MLKRDCWQARSNWSAEISMARARLSWALLCSMMIRPLLLAHWTKRHPRISGLAEARKQIGCPGSCARDIPITPAVDSMSVAAALWAAWRADVKRLSVTLRRAKRLQKHDCQRAAYLIASTHEQISSAPR